MIGPLRGKYFFLANYFPTSFGSVEHHYAAAKTTDPFWKKKILEAPTAGMAKRFGRRAPQRADWEAVKLEAMEDLVTMKFFAHPELAEQLCATVDDERAEVIGWGGAFWGS